MLIHINNDRLHHIYQGFPHFGMDLLAPLLAPQSEAVNGAWVQRFIDLHQQHMELLVGWTSLDSGGEISPKKLGILAWPLVN